MKLQLLHGLGISASRKKLTEIKNKFASNAVITFDSDSNIQSILNALTTPSLLDEEQLIVWENPPEEFAHDSLFMTHHSSLILWFDHKIKETSKILKWVKEQKGEVLNFPEEKEISIFPFLDLLANKDKRAFLELKKLKEADFDIFYFLTMAFYLLRNLTVTPQNAPSFVKQKIDRQRKNFVTEEITEIYKNLLEIDFKIKSGFLEKDHAEYLLVNIFTK